MKLNRVLKCTKITWVSIFFFFFCFTNEIHVAGLLWNYGEKRALLRSAELFPPLINRNRWAIRTSVSEWNREWGGGLYTDIEIAIYRGSSLSSFSFVSEFKTLKNEEERQSERTFCSNTTNELFNWYYSYNYWYLILINNWRYENWFAKENMIM